MADRDQETILADGRRVTTDELAPLLYDELREMAENFFRKERPGLTLQPTALVHEAWMRLASQEQDWANRSHFLALAATTMRRVLSNAGRARKADKRGGDRARVTLSGAEVEEGTSGSELDVDILDLDAALETLAGVNERYVRILELRYFAGLSIEEAAEVMGLSRTQIVREWAKAKAWLAAKLEGGPS